MIDKMSISAFVITYNEEKNIRQCLNSIEWADEIVVVDSFSTDRTAEIASEYTDRLIQREWPGNTKQTRYASELTTCPWVLWLDADERFTQQALREVQGLFARPGGPPANGLAFPRKTYFMGRWISHSGWYPQHKVRLWHRDFGQVTGRPFHPRVEMCGATRKLKGDVLHYTYPGGIRDLLAGSAGYAAGGARNSYAEGRRFSWLRLLAKPPGVFFKKYLLQMGFLDGLPGLLISLSDAYYRFAREAMFWDLEHATDEQEGP